MILAGSTAVLSEVTYYLVEMRVLAWISWDIFELDSGEMELLLRCAVPVVGGP